MTPPSFATADFLAEHYLYEVSMLRAAHLLLASAASREHANALIESFAVHARNLMAFYLSVPRGDDAVAAHFTVTGTFPAAGIAAIAKRLRTRLNKQIAHFTYARTDAVKIGPADREALLRALESDHAAFKRAVAPRLAECFKKQAPCAAALPELAARNVFYIS